MSTGLFKNVNHKMCFYKSSSSHAASMNFPDFFLPFLLMFYRTQ